MRYAVRLQLDTRYGSLRTLVGEYRFKITAMIKAWATIRQYTTGAVTIERIPESHR